MIVWYHREFFKDILLRKELVISYLCLLRRWNVWLIAIEENFFVREIKLDGETSAEYFVLKRIGIDKIGSISLVTQGNFIVRVVVDWIVHTASDLRERN